jgi:Zn-dependent protease with chaperone function
MLFLYPIILVNPEFGAFLFRQFFAICVFFISFVMVVYMLFDYIVGVTVFRLTTGRLDTKTYKAKEFEAFFAVLDKVFTEAKKRFPIGSVGLYIKKSSEINAFAVGSMRKNAIILSSNLLNLLRSKAKTNEDFENAVAGVIGHEMSHLINKDFLPGMLFEENRRATDRFAKIISFLYTFIFFLLSRIPLLGRLVSYLSKFVYLLTFKISYLFLQKVAHPLYRFLHIFISKATEFRCDKEAAKVFGQGSIGSALDYLGVKTYNSIFSHHPSISNRLKNLEGVKQIKSTIIVPNLLTNLLNLITVIALFFCPYMIAKWANLNASWHAVCEFFEAIFNFIGYCVNLIYSFIDFIANIFRGLKI